MHNPNTQSYMGMNYPPYLYYPQQYGGYNNQPQDPSLIDNNQEELNNITTYIKNLRDPAKREDALNKLSRKR